MPIISKLNIKLNYYFLYKLTPVVQYLNNEYIDQVQLINNSIDFCEIDEYLTFDEMFDILISNKSTFNFEKLIFSSNYDHICKNELLTYYRNENKQQFVNTITQNKCDIEKLHKICIYLKKSSSTHTEQFIQSTGINLLDTNEEAENNLKLKELKYNLGHEVNTDSKPNDDFIDLQVEDFRMCAKLLQHYYWNCEYELSPAEKHYIDKLVLDPELSDIYNIAHKLNSSYSSPTSNFLE